MRRGLGFFVWDVCEDLVFEADGGDIFEEVQRMAMRGASTMVTLRALLALPILELQPCGAVDHCSRSEKSYRAHASLPTKI